MADTTAALVKSLRKRLGLTQEDVAARAAEGDPEFRRDYVTKVETGANKASTQRVRAGLARGLGLSVEDFEAFLAGRLGIEAATLRAVDPRSEPAPRPPELVIEREDQRVPDDDEVPLETALFAVFAALRRLYATADFEAARLWVRSSHRKVHPEGDLEESARQLLDAAKSLRVEGLPVTPTNLAIRLLAGKTRHAAERLDEVSAAYNADADASLRALGHEPEQGAEDTRARVEALKARRRAREE